MNTEDISFSEFLEDYFAESEEHLVSIRRHLLVLEGFVSSGRIDPEFPVMDELLGALHSIKGLSGMVGFHDVEQLAHAMEESIRSLKNGEASPAEESMKALVSGTEIIEQIIAARRQQQSGPDVHAALTRFTAVALSRMESATEAQEPETPETAPVSLPGGVRVDMKRLDHLMEMVGDLVISRGHMDETLRRLEDVLPSSAWRELQEASFVLQRQLRNLRESVMRMRMVPIGNIFERMRFLVRGLERTNLKSIHLELTGEKTEIDKLLVERMMDPLLHMVRNAVTHGLEPADERIAAGKTAEGHLWIRARTEAETVVIELEDDGRGVDIDKVVSRSRALGLLENGTPDAVRVLQMICAPGFSTREQADLGAGHGVGMTIVKTTISGLGGTLAMDTRPGKGTRFVIRLPLTLAIMESLIVYVNEQPFAVPRSLIQEVLRVESHTVETVEEGEVIPWRGGVLPIVRLHRMFRMNRIPRISFHVFVVDADSSAVGIAVDRISRQREIVARPVEDPLVRVPGIAGATELGDGRPVLILDVAAIVDSMRGHRDPVPDVVTSS